MISIADTTSQGYKNGQNENRFRDLCIIFFSEIMPEAFTWTQEWYELQILDTSQVSQMDKMKPIRFKCMSNSLRFVESLRVRVPHLS